MLMLGWVLDDIELYLIYMPDKMDTKTMLKVTFFMILNIFSLYVIDVM